MFLMLFIMYLSGVALVCYVVARFVLSGPKLSNFDQAVGEVFDEHPDDAAANERFLASLKPLRSNIIKTRSLKRGFKMAREFADNLSADLQTDAIFKSVMAHSVPCEWTIAPNADTSRRVLFLHGGAFFLGSPKGHRIMTNKLSYLANAAVLAVDYRMLPEHGRAKGISDVQTAYRWLLSNGPEGESKVEFLLVVGDSAGGNLALMLSAWSKTIFSRRPDGVIGLSPSSDVTMSSPTIKANLPSDKILGEGLGQLIKIPAIFRAWVGLFVSRMNPANPLSSPLLGDLSDLPKTLIHASSSEMLLGESIRYTNKAVAAGSDVTLQIWRNQLHDWHLFNMGIGSAKQAWQEIGKFIDQLPQNQLSQK